MDRGRLPLLPSYPRGRQALTCRYRCGDACRHEPPNPTENPSFDEVVARTVHERWEVLEVSVPEELRPHLVRKGSVAVDGTSLTVSGLTDAGFEVSLIPTTLAETTLGRRAVGDRVNLETDVLAKYVAGLLGDRQAAS